MKRIKKVGSARYWGWLVMIIMFIIDIRTPLGFADYFMYSGCLLIFIMTNDKRYIFLATILSVLLLILGYFLSPPNPLLLTSLAVTNRCLSIILLVATAVGITKFMDNRNLLVEKINELENASKELESFNFISSHDLQEPLRKMQNFTSMLIKEKNISDDGKYYLDALTGTAKKMRMLIEDLLQYTRMKSANLYFEKANIKTILEEVIADFKELINEKKASIYIEADCEASIIIFQFRQLFANLISNSLKFSQPDKQLQIIIKSENIYGSKLIPKLSPDIKYCHISFIDNGIGFDPQYNERIFVFFERLNGEKYPGTGLGLAICKKIIENHNGLITANGEINKGARFDTYIPSDRKETSVKRFID